MIKITSTLSLPVKITNNGEMVDSFGDVVATFENDVDTRPIVQAINDFDKLVFDFDELTTHTPVTAWVDCTERLPLIDDNRWRTAKPLPVMTKSVGLTYAYACVTSTLHRYWQESSTMGNADSKECETYDGCIRGEMVGVVSWMDIKEPLS